MNISNASGGGLEGLNDRGDDNMKIERTFNGSNDLEEILLQLIKIHVDKLNKPVYDENRANTIPSTDTEGMAS